jgi:uncharacterized protein DUF3971
MSGAARTFAAIACAVLVAGALVVGALAWRLSRGPIGLGVLTPRLEAALGAPDGSMRVDIDSTSLEWDPRDRDLGVRVTGLRVLGPGGAPVAEVPALAVGIAPGPLLLGMVTPRSIEAIGPRIQVVREQDGRLDVGLGTEPGSAPTHLLLGALAGGEPRGGLAALRTVGMRDGDILVDDRASGTTWHATQASLTARRDASGVTIERLAFDVGPASVVATGRVRGGTVDVEATLRTLPTRLLEGWWPAAVAPAMRRWVLANVSRGGVTSARTTLTGTLADQGAPRLALGRVDGRVAFAGLDVRWRDGMPPLTGVAGIGTFSAGGWQLRLARGEVEGLDLVRAGVAPAAGGGPAIGVDAVVRAPLSKVLALLERPAMRGAAAFPFRPGELSGGAAARVLVRVPLDGAAAGVQAHGELRSVSLRRAFRGRNVNARRLRFDLDGREFEMRGEIAVGRAPLHLRWREAFAGATRGQRVITVKGRLGAEGRQALGADLSSWIEGPVDVQARFGPKTQGATTVNVRVDLTLAAIDLPLINVVKDVGAPGSSDARLVLAGGKVTAVDAFRLQAAGASVTGRALLAPDESVRAADGTIDMPPRAENGPTGHVAVALKPAGTGSELTVTSDDAGIVFRAADSFADAKGGHLKLTGAIRLGVPGLPFTGTLTADSFVLTRSPMLAKIAALGAVGGVIDLLAADGLPFSQLAVTFTQRAGVINVTEAVCASLGLALTARGTVDRVRDELSLDGTMVPNYAGLAQLAKDVPDVGTVLTGLGNGGVKALDFSVSGSLADPYVTAKPATGISPAILRDLQRLTAPRVNLTGSSKRKGMTDEEQEADVDVVPGRRRRTGARSSRPAGRARTDTEVTTPAKPRIRRRAVAGPAARGTDIE